MRSIETPGGRSPRARCWILQHPVRHGAHDSENVLARTLHRLAGDYPSHPDVYGTLMLTPITISIALMCCAFIVAVTYVALDERV